MKFPCIYVASATGIGGRWQGSYGWLRDDALAGSIPTILLMDRYATKQMVADLKAKGLAVWAWETPGPVGEPDGHEYHTDGLTPQRFTDMGYDGVVMQCENPDQRIGSLRLFQQGLAAGKEKHIVTYYFGFDDGHGAEYWAEFKAAGVTKVHVECYAADNHRDAAAYVDRGVACGFPREDIVCIFGTYRNEFPQDYANTLSVGRVFGCYIVDQWKDDTAGDPNKTTWKTWGGMNKVATLSYWRIVGNTTGKTLFEARAATWTEMVPVPGGGAGSVPVTVNGLQKCRDWVDHNEATIRAEVGYSQTKVQH